MNNNRSVTNNIFSPYFRNNSNMSSQRTTLSQEYKQILKCFKKDGSGVLNQELFDALPDEPIDEKKKICEKLVDETKVRAKGLYFSLGQINARVEIRERELDDLSIDGTITLEDSLTSSLKTDDAIKYLQFKKEEIKDEQVA